MHRRVWVGLQQRKLLVSCCKSSACRCVCWWGSRVLQCTKGCEGRVFILPHVAGLKLALDGMSAACTSNGCSVHQCCACGVVSCTSAQHAGAAAGCLSYASCKTTFAAAL